MTIFSAGRPGLVEVSEVEVKVRVISKYDVAGNDKILTNLTQVPFWR